MKLETAIKNYAEARKQLIEMLGTDSISDIGGNVRLSTLNEKLVLGLESAEVDQETDAFDEILRVSAEQDGIEIYCYAWKADIKKAAQPGRKKVVQLNSQADYITDKKEVQA
jgi:hypothetical protein